MGIMLLAQPLQRPGLQAAKPTVPPGPCCPLPLLAAIKKAVEEGHDVNEVEAAGNTPLHFACWQGWIEG